MDEELSVLKANHTWEMIVFPPCASIIGSKWIYSIKVKMDGTLDRYKAWLVAQGYKQEYDIDYKETFALVATMTMALLSIATVRHWPYGK